MGRRIPDDSLSLSLILHPLLYLSFVAAGVAASIAIIASLCSVLFWKKTSPSLSDPSSQETKNKLDVSCSESDKEATVTSPPDPRLEDTTPEAPKELPLPPAMQQPREPHIPINMKRAASERRMSFNLSIKLPRTLSVARHWDQQQKEETSKKKKGKAEEVWTKTIILGEKCQVPEDHEDAVIYEGKGKKVSAYHPKTKSTMSNSHISYIDTDDSLHAPQQNHEQNLNQ